MVYSVQIERKALKFISKLEAAPRKQISKAIDSLSEDPRPPGARKLTNRPGWRVRCGDYRLLYGIDDAILSVCVAAIDHRRNIYRR